MTHVIDAEGRIKRTTGIVGSGVAGQVAIWSAAAVIAGDAGFTYVAATDTLSAGVLELPATTASVGQIMQAAATILHSYGANNLFIGAGAGNFTLTNNRNTALGISALSALTDGTGNTAIGYLALLSNTGGDQNLAVGREALIANLTGNFNMALGNRTLASNLTGLSNVAIGNAALLSNQSANRNMAIGSSSLSSNVTGSENVAVGSSGLRLNTGSENIGIGTDAGRNKTGGDGNVFIGYEASEGTGAAIREHNVVIGGNAGELMQTSDHNILIGYQAGDVLTTGDNNIIIGYNIDPSAAGASSELNIGAVIYGTLTANQNITINALTVSAHYDLMLAGDGVLGLKEAATPTADATYGKLYCKDDNLLYFQDGAGAEHVVAFA